MRQRTFEERIVPIDASRARASGSIKPRIECARVEGGFDQGFRRLKFRRGSQPTSQLREDRGRANFRFPIVDDHGADPTMRTLRTHYDFVKQVTSVCYLYPPRFHIQ